MKYFNTIRTIITLSICFCTFNAFADLTISDLPHTDGTPLQPSEEITSWQIMEITETESSIQSAWLENQGNLAYLVYSNDPNPEAPEVFTFGDGYEVELINEINLHFIMNEETQLQFDRPNWKLDLHGTEAKASYPTNTLQENSGRLYVESNLKITLYDVASSGTIYVSTIVEKAENINEQVYPSLQMGDNNSLVSAEIVYIDMSPSKPLSLQNPNTIANDLTINTAAMSDLYLNGSEGIGTPILLVSCLENENNDISNSERREAECIDYQPIEYFEGNSNSTSQESAPRKKKKGGTTSTALLLLTLPLFVFRRRQSCRENI